MVLYPRHQIVDVFGCRAFDWFFDGGAVSPVILIPTKGMENVGNNSVFAWAISRPLYTVLTNNNKNGGGGLVDDIHCTFCLE